MPSLCCIASFGEFVSGQPFNDLMIFHILRSSFSLMVESRRSSQLSCRAFLISSWASLQASSHSCLCWPTFFLKRFRFLSAALTVGVMNIFDLFLGLVFPTCFIAASLRVWLNLRILFVMFASSGICSMESSTADLKSSQFTPFLFHLGAFPKTGWCTILEFTVILIGRWSELPICSPTSHLHFSLHFRPASVTSGVLSFPVIRLTLVGEPSFRIESCCCNAQSSISSPLLSDCWIKSQRGECPFNSPVMMELSCVGMISGQKAISWSMLFVGGTYTLEIDIHFF